MILLRKKKLRWLPGHFIVSNFAHLNRSGLLLCLNQYMTCGGFCPGHYTRYMTCSKIKMQITSSHGSSSPSERWLKATPKTSLWKQLLAYMQLYWQASSCCCCCYYHKVVIIFDSLDRFMVHEWPDNDVLSERINEWCFVVRLIVHFFWSVGTFATKRN